MTEPMGLEAYADIRFLQPEECAFEQTPGGLLALTIAGERHEDISVQRAFPFTHGDDFLSIRDKDAKEIGMIRSLKPFDKKTRKLLTQELERRYFVPEVRRIVRIKEEFGYSYWDVETDRGSRRFTVRGIQDSVIPITEKRLLILDVDGNRFEIPDVTSLDARSLKFIDALL